MSDNHSTSSVGKRKKAASGEPLTFLKSAVTADSADCILWPFAITKTGYGNIAHGGMFVSAHSVALALVIEKPFPRAVARHTCRNRLCVNPNHLEWGTHKQNSRDMFRDGTIKLGEQRAFAKLKDSDIPRIRQMRTEGKTHQTIADCFNVSRRTITFVLNGVTWKHVPSEANSENS